MREIPRPPAASETDSAESYGLQLLAYVVREGTAVLLSDEAIALALHVAPVAAAVRVQISTDGSKTRSVDYRIAAADAIADAKRELLSSQRIRQLLAAERAAEQPAAAARAAEQLPGGSLVDRRPIVGPLSPAGAAATLSQPGRAIVDWDQTF